MSLVHRFGDFQLLPDQRQLLGADGTPVALGQRAFDVLLVLVERAGLLVGKDELLERAWPGLVVEENNLQVQVSTLRKILGANAITTTAGRGYRFTLPLAPAVDAPAPTVARKHNLPRPLTSFVGHDDDLGEYAELLRETRLLTLTGIGGCGKTRLALELAQRVVPDYADGVWYVDLAPLQDAERVALAVATTLGIREEADRTIADTIAGYLAHRELLLVIDNCEHLMTPCASLVKQIVNEQPGVRVLAASREGLGVPGERAVTVRSLSFPAAGAPPDLDALEGTESVRLFVDRVRLAMPKFALTPENAAAVAEICRRLDGIPLAIELAAARVKMLSVDEIRARLDDRFRLLTGGSRSALGRQQTLLAAIRWSYDHLGSDQQTLMRRLSVFAGGWTLEGAVRVAGDDRDEYQVLEEISRLVDQSLVSTQHVAGDASRYSMLETVRQYAHERLDDSGEGVEARGRHLAWCVELAERAMPELSLPEQQRWLERLDHELENFLAAHAWCEHAADGARLDLRLVFALAQYLRARGLMALAWRISAEALARPGAQARDLDRCRALWAASEPAYYLGRYAEAREYAEASLAIARELGDPSRVAQAVRMVGYALLAFGDHAAAQACFEEGIELSQRHGDKRQQSSAMCGLGELFRTIGDPVRALPYYEEAQRLAIEHGDPGGCSIGYSNLAMASILVGSVERARELVLESMAVADKTGQRHCGVAQLDCTMGLAATLGEWTYAARLSAAVDEWSKELGYRREPADEAFVSPLLAKTRNALGAVAFAKAADAGRRMSHDEAYEEARAWLESLEFADEARVVARQAGD